MELILILVIFIAFEIYRINKKIDDLAKKVNNDHKILEEKIYENEGNLIRKLEELKNIQKEDK